MYKGIFWCYSVCWDDDISCNHLLPVRVRCDMNGEPLEEAEFSAKSGENFNHEKEWEKLKEMARICRRYPYNYFPRGRVEVKGGAVKIFANLIIMEDDEAKKLIVEAFELSDINNIKWIADNSDHYRYCMDAMGEDSGVWLDDED